MPRSVLQIGVLELRRRPGTQRQVELSTPLPGLAITSAHVPDHTDVAVDVVLEAIDGAVTVTGSVSARWEGECRRCLEPVSGTLEAEVREVYEVRYTEGETYPLVGDEIDLEPVVRDAVLLALPLAPLCRETCPGPVPDAFPTGPAGEERLAAQAAEEAGEEPAGDPRWAALRELRLDDE